MHACTCPSQPVPQSPRLPNTPPPIPPVACALAEKGEELTGELLFSIPADYTIFKSVLKDDLGIKPLLIKNKLAAAMQEIWQEAAEAAALQAPGTAPAFKRLRLTWAGDAGADGAVGGGADGAAARQPLADLDVNVSWGGVGVYALLSGCCSCSLVGLQEDVCWYG